MLEPAHLTKTEAALRAVRARIHSGDLPVGARLQVNELAADLGVSHTPVREALRVLSADGLVEFRSHRGAVVADTASRIEEVWSLRALLEPAAVARAIPRLDARALAELEDIHDRLLHATGMDLSAQNQRWHFAIYDACDAPTLLGFVRRLWEQVPWRTVWMLPGRSGATASEHEVVMAAIRDGDAAAAAECMCDHIRSALGSVTHSAEQGLSTTIGRNPTT